MIGKSLVMVFEKQEYDGGREETIKYFLQLQQSNMDVQFP